MKIAHGVRWSVHASSFLWFFVDDLSSIGDRGSFAVPFRARLMPTKPAATSRSESFSVGFTFGPLLLCFFFFLSLVVVTHRARLFRVLCRKIFIYSRSRSPAIRSAFPEFINRNALAYHTLFRLGKVFLEI